MGHLNMYAKITLGFLLGTFLSKVWSQVTNVNPGSCTYSFVVPQTDLLSKCKSYSSAQIETLQSKVTDLQSQMEVLQGYTMSTNDTVMNPIFTCGCNNKTEIAFSYRDCQDVKTLKAGPSGVYEVEPVKETGYLISAEGDIGKNKHYWSTVTWEKIKVYCEVGSENVGWTVIMRRKSMNVSFDRTWDEYKNGFGEIETGGDFWIGLEKIYQITSQTFSKYSLWIAAVDNKAVPHIIPYESFKLKSSDEGYALDISGFHGKVRNELVTDRSFMTKDRNTREGKYADDNYYYSDINCANEDGVMGKSGWWFTESYKYSYNDDATCGGSNLNAKSPFWRGLGNLTSVEMKIRPTI